jgi:hypothetical protein
VSQSTVLVKVSADHAAFLINARKRLLLFALFVRSLCVKMLARAYHLVHSVLAIVSIFMSHRHRHEPADDRLLSKVSSSVLGGVH